MFKPNSKLGKTYCEAYYDGGIVFVEILGQFYCRRYFTNERRALVARELVLEGK